MCGRFTQQTPTSDIARIFGADDLTEAVEPRYNVAPTDDATVVVERPGEDGASPRRAVVRYRWGLLPHWVPDPRRAQLAINARAETITTSGLYRDAFAKRRCIVPVDSFYEWRGSGAARQPFRIHDPSGAPLALAGLWAGRRDPETDLVTRSCTIVTSAPNAFMAAIHDRMPVVLPREEWDRWLDPTVDPALLRPLLEPREDVRLAMHPVSKLVNSVRNQGPELIAPVAALDVPDSPLTLALD